MSASPAVPAARNPSRDEELPVSVGAGIPELHFVRPLPGFASLTRYALVRIDPGAALAGEEKIISSDDVAAEQGVSGQAGEQDAEFPPAVFELRSLQAPDVRFLVANPGAFFPDYGFELDSEAAEDLGLRNSEDAVTLVVLTIGDDAASTTANLLAPVVVNARNRSAAQIILSGTDWPVRANVA